jgi:hypothetical protein
MAGLDCNGYAPSIVPGHSEFACWVCGCNGRGKMDRHEIFYGPNRQKSKRLGLWVHLCHSECHLNGVHKSGLLDKELKAEGQRCAMRKYGWTTERFIQEIGKSYV